MKSKTTIFSVIILAGLILAACKGGAAASETIVEKPAKKAMAGMTTEEVLMDESIPDTMQENSSDSDMMHQTTPDQATPEKMMEAGTPEAVMEKSTPEAMLDDSMVMPGWFSTPLTDVRSGEQFTISDLEGKVVLVETMAMWCSNCLKQQKQVLELHSLLGERDDFISLGLDIDPNEIGGALQAYTETNGFFWRYAISPTEVSREIGQLYGDQFLNPPSTPMLIIDRHGQAHPLPFGIKDAQSLMEALEPFLAENM